MRPKHTRARFQRPKQAAAPQPQPAVDLARAIQEALQIHQAGQLDAAEAIYRKVLTIQPENPDALHLLGFICHQRNQAELAAELVGKAVALQPDRTIFLNNYGIILTSLGRREEAMECYRRALRIQPDFYMALGNLGGCLADLGQREESIDCYQRALAANPNGIEVLNSLGNVLLKAGRYQEAMASYQKAITIQPNYADAYNGMGTALRDSGQFEESIAWFHKGLQIHPNHYDMHTGLGNALLAYGKPEAALTCYEQAIRINPNHPNAYHNLGGALRSLGKFTEAIAYFQKALALSPNLHQTHNSLGNTLYDQDRLAEAFLCYQKALAIQPNDPDTLNNMGIVLTDQGKLEEAIECYKKMALLAPRNPAAQCDVINQLLHICDWREVQSRYRQMMEVFHAEKKETSPFVFLALPTTPAEQRRGAELYMANKYPTRGDLSATRQYDPQPARLKIGYLSSDFANHPVAYLTAELLEMHDRSRFEITAYSYGPDDGREMRRRIMAASDQFVDLRPLTFSDAAQRIFDDGTHILMDLNGFTKHARMQILALRPAPLQASWLGYLGTLGAPFIDYLMSDSFITPPGCEADFTEKLVRLPECFQPNDRQRNIAEHTPTRQERGLPEEGVVFASFNKSYKFNPEMFDVWMSILRKAPNSILWLVASNHLVETNLRREAEARGVSQSRIFFVPKMPLADYLANYRLVDLVLDTFPYNSGTTASNSLWAGCPMLTCAGKTFVSRQAGSLLRTVGLPELVTHSLAEYEAVALALANDPPRLAAIRQRLQANLLTTPLFDTPRFTKHLEAAYESMWQRFRSGLLPDHLDIPPINSQVPPQPPSGTVSSRREVTTAAATQDRPAADSEDPLRSQAAEQHPPARQSDEAEAIYRQLIEKHPDRANLSSALGGLFFQRGQPQVAAAWMARAVALQPDQPVFLYNLGILRAELGQHEDAIDCFKKILASQPSHHDALSQMGHALRALDRRLEAMQCYQAAIAIQPTLHEVHLGMGNLLRAEKKWAAAAACYRQTVALAPDHHNAYANLGYVLFEQGDMAGAIACYQRAIELNPSLSEAHNGLGNVLRAEGKLDAALLCFQKALAGNPMLYTACHNQGLALHQQGRLDEALEAYQKALTIHPHSYETWHAMGRAMANLGRMAEAIDCYQRAIGIDPQFHPAYNSLGSAMQHLEKPEEAEAYYEKALSIQPDEPETLRNLGILRAYQRRLDEAADYYRQVVALSPESPALRCELLHQLLYICDWRDFQNSCQQMLDLFHANAQEASPFIFLTLPTTPEEYKRCTELYTKNRYPTRDNLAATRSYGSDPDRLTIGYLSYDYKDHPCGYVAADLFPQHDRTQVKVIAYSLSPEDESSVRKCVKAGSDLFVDLYPLSHREAAQRILDDGVHILVDANGFTRGTRLQIPALRPAPIQLSWQGNTSMTMGAPFFDYCLTDYFMAPPGCESRFVEKLVRLPHHFQSRRTAAHTTPSRQACGLPEEGFVFVCFNQPYKINPPLFDCWMRLLRAIPGSVLWLRAFNTWAVDNLRCAAENRGVMGSRLVFATRTEEPTEHVARYRLADLALDTFPYTSGSTAWDTLSAGCPMVSCAGQSSFSRAAASQLIHVGLPDLVTHSLEAYTELAMALANDPARLAAIRRRLQKNLPTAPLFDAPLFARHLEAAYRTMWQRFQAGLPPEHIHIAPLPDTASPSVPFPVQPATPQERDAAIIKKKSHRHPQPTGHSSEPIRPRRCSGHFNTTGRATCRKPRPSTAKL
ncbi:MAG: tetratricopeptide repeat protein [Magnetococcus sp. XQGC-1]